VTGKVTVIDLDGWHEDSLTVDGMQRLARAFNDRLASGTP
jgi:hypothetical protein